jgi:beta-glucosidase
MPDPPRFADDFLWGAATSAYQVEGSPLAEGAGPSIWHRFSHTPGRIWNGDTGDTACDHYRRFESDVKLMRELGLNAYRFSISWSRVIPEGRGRINSRGLDFYQRLVDSLLQHGIQPFVTLYHWDLPAALDDRGGWLVRDSASWFADYAREMFRALDDRVRFWTTLNEPWVVADAGYLHGVHAPGHADLLEAPLVSFNLLRAHASAVEVYRAEGRHEIGIVVNLEPKYPASDRPEDIAATARARAYMNRQYLDPIFFGTYPTALHEIFGEAWPGFSETDLSKIRKGIDFLGINYYTRAVTRDDPTALLTRASTVHQHGSTYTELGWEVYPQGLTDTLLWVRNRYGALPLYVTENGAVFADPPIGRGALVDLPRLDYYRAHLRAAEAAIRNGVDLRGYFAWSLLDNFEWAWGYSKRFGIVHVDFQTQQRTPKDSALFYSRVIRTKGDALYEADPSERCAETP